MLLLDQVFQIINESGLDYCIQNKYEMMPEEIPSDIDMMYRNADEEFLDELIIKISRATGLLVTQKIVQGYFEYTYILSYPMPKERFQLQLDFYRAISSKGYLYVMPAEDMIETKRLFKGFYVPDYYIELKYMWIRRTIKKDLTEEHIHLAKQLYERNPEEYHSALVRDFGIQAVELMVAIMDQNMCSLFYDNLEVFQKSVKAVSKKNATASVHIKKLIFVMFTLIPKRFIRKSGISVAFLSPDGGGKSTIIKQISETVSGSFYGKKIFYIRPRFFKNIGHYNLLNQTGESTGNPDPHGKNLHNPMKSLLRFLFYNLDYILGTWLKIIPLKIKKYIVIFDRYYYDYYVDMKRYQYSLPNWLPKVLAWSIPKPDMVFVLDADPQILYQRKQELSFDELKRQVAEYKKIGQKLNNAYIIDASQSLEKVTENVTRQILLYKAKQTVKIMKIKLDKDGMPL